MVLCELHLSLRRKTRKLEMFASPKSQAIAVPLKGGATVLKVGVQFFDPPHLLSTLEDTKQTTAHVSLL